MYTYCPNCLAIYQISREHIQKAGGKTRCSECRQVYHANEYLFDDLDTLHRTVADRQAASDQERGEADRYAPLDLPEPQASGWDITTETDAADRRHAESWQQRTVSMSYIGSGLVVGLLVLLLGAQWVYFNREALAAHNAWRPSLERFCEVLMCELPMRVELAEFGIVERDVRKHPGVEEALLINVAFENRAAFNQPYPLFEVSFTDSSGTPVAMRRFTPAEYLGESVDSAAGMSPHTTAQVVLEVIDPGEQAVSFQFGFL
jgi:predicted Zn finger-like uncharacterized protein